MITVKSKIVVLSIWFTPESAINYHRFAIISWYGKRIANWITIETKGDNKIRIRRDRTRYQSLVDTDGTDGTVRESCIE